jgi:hypothetical protein
MILFGKNGQKHPNLSINSNRQYPTVAMIRIPYQ